MNPYPFTEAQARFLYEKAGFAAYCAYRRLEREVDRDFEDIKQEAVLAFWKTWCQKGDMAYSFVAGSLCSAWVLCLVHGGKDHRHRPGPGTEGTAGAVHGLLALGSG